MPIVLSLVDAIVFFIGAVCKVFYWLLIFRVILSWVGVTPYTNLNELLSAIFQATDIILKPFQRLPLRIGIIDFTPIIVIYLLHILPGLVASVLSSLLGGLR